MIGRGGFRGIAIRFLFSCKVRFWLGSSTICYIVVVDNATLPWVLGGSSVCLMIVWLVAPIAIIAICPGLVLGLKAIHMNSL